VRIAKSAKEAWDELEKIHAPNDLHRQLALQRQLITCKMSSNTTLQDHEAAFSGIIDALSDTGKDTHPLEVVNHYLMSLSEEYEAFGQDLALKIQDNWTFNSVTGIVRMEAQPRAGETSTSLIHSPPKHTSPRERTAAGGTAGRRKASSRGSAIIAM
jgi:hypothetical protein